jgi:hypothetical protein
MGKEVDRLLQLLLPPQREKFWATAQQLALYADLSTAQAAETMAKVINAAPVSPEEGLYLAARKVATGTVWTMADPDPAWLRQIPSALREGVVTADTTPPPDEPFFKIQPSEVVQFPHCDSSVLHAPGECRFCDGHRDWQAYREGARINFTGHADEGKAPCPSEHFRPAETRDRWPGNVAAPEGEPVPSYWPPELLEAIDLGASSPGSYGLQREMFGTDMDQAAYVAAQNTGYGDYEPKAPVYPWYVRAWARLRWALRL